MTSWARRMHRRAATLSNVVTSCGHPNSLPYPRRLEKVKFGVPLDEVCKNDIPGPLLVLILKLNKEAPLRRDVFRAPGHQGAMKKLIHFLQAGRLVNVDNYSVYTIASVLKKFLRKIPGGVFGREGELQLFSAVELPDKEQIDEIRRLVLELPLCTQRLLVLLFGTFRVMASNAERAQTGMTAEALGVSVAPSFFHSCVSDGKQATMEDVQRFKVATRIMRQLIDQFSAGDLFGRDNYEFYARVTGRILRVRDEWICSFRDPPPPRHPIDQQDYAKQLSLEAEKTWLQCESDRWGMKYNLEAMSKSEECQSMPALMVPSLGLAQGSTLGIIPEHTLLDSCTRLSISLEESVFKVSMSSSSHSSRTSSSAHMTLEELRAVNRYAESTKSLSFLPQVHERQRARMQTRSEWFLRPPASLDFHHHPIGTATEDCFHCNYYQYDVRDDARRDYCVVECHSFELLNGDEVILVRNTTTDALQRSYDRSRSFGLERASSASLLSLNYVGRADDLTDDETDGQTGVSCVRSSETTRTLESARTHRSSKDEEGGRALFLLVACLDFLF